MNDAIMSRFEEEILSLFHKEVLFTSHALHQMNLPERMITKQEVKETVLYGEIIGDYPEDIRGHVVCSCRHSVLSGSSMLSAHPGRNI